VQAPVLLVVGGADEEVLRLNREAAAGIAAPVDLRVVPGATHLFAEPGALEDVIDLAVTALDRHLPSNSDPSNSDGVSAERSSS
jgi:putative phosphoribosyl transferase